MDEAEREAWYQDFLRAGMECVPERTTASKVRKWARSMSLIAEQFTDNRDGEPVEAALT